MKEKERLPLRLIMQIISHVGYIMRFAFKQIILLLALFGYAVFLSGGDFVNYQSTVLTSFFIIILYTVGIIFENLIAGNNGLDMIYELLYSITAGVIVYVGILLDVIGALLIITGVLSFVAFYIEEMYINHELKKIREKGVTYGIAKKTQNAGTERDDLPGNL